MGRRRVKIIRRGPRMVSGKVRKKRLCCLPLVRLVVLILFILIVIFFFVI